MITITKQNDGVLFTFENSDKYLYGNGSILVPFNTLSIVADESDMITLKKAASNDVFISARYDTDLGYRSKDDAIDDLKGMLFAETGGGSGSGVTPSEVQTMIDSSISGKADASALTSHADNVNVHFSGTQKSNYDGLEAQYYVDDNWDVMPMSVFNDFTNDYSAAMGQFDQRISANTSAIATKADTSALTAVANDVQTVSGQVQTKVATSDFNTYSAATATAIGNKQDKLEYYEENTEDGWAEMRVATDDGDGNTSDQHISIGGGLEIGNYQEYNDGQGNTGFTSTNIQFNNPEINMYAESEDNGETETTYFNITPTSVTINDDAVATEPYVDAATSGKADTSAVTQVNNALTAHTANTTVHVSQAEKDIWNTKANIDHVTQAEYSAMEQAGTLDSNTMYIIDDAVPFDPSTKVDVSAITSSITSGSTNAEIPTAKATYDAIQAGGGGGATYSAGTNISIANDTINCTLPITANTGNKNVTVGYDLNVREEGETSIGKYNVNRYRNATTHSENTIFTVGNGGSNGLRHNALEIRKSGDLYFADTSNGGQSYYQKPMVRLQDMYAALGGLKFVQCSQSEYDSMVSGGTVDSSTIYFITNVVS